MNPHEVRRDTASRIMSEPDSAVPADLTADPRARIISQVMQCFCGRAFGLFWRLKTNVKNIARGSSPCGKTRDDIQFYGQNDRDDRTASWSQHTMAKQNASKSRRQRCQNDRPDALVSPALTFLIGKENAGNGPQCATAQFSPRDFR